MEARTNLKQIARDTVVDGVGESTRDKATQIANGNRTHLWHGKQEVKSAPQLALKLCTQADSLALVPLIGLLNIRDSARGEANFEPAQAPRRRALSSSKLM